MDEFPNSIYQKTLKLIEDKGEVLSRIRVEQAKQDREAEIRYVREKGKEEEKEKEKIEIATKLKNKGISIPIIVETTGIPISKIKKL